MKIKTFWTNCTEDYEFDDKVNQFIEDKQIIQISSSDTILPYEDHNHTLTVLYKEEDIDEDF